MEKHCVLLETAKKLKEAGWNDNTRFIFNNSGDLVAKYKCKNYYNAPLAYSILEKLPFIITDCCIEYVLEIDKDKSNNKNIIRYKEKSGYMNCYLTEDIISHKRLSDALALMWIWLKENGYIK